MQRNFKTLLQTIQHDKLFPHSKMVIVAVSGGVDSLALLHWLATHQKQLSIDLHVATLNHGLRPQAADEVAYVQQIANSLNIHCTIGETNVTDIAEHYNMGLEAAARKARYDFLADVAQKLNTSHIATAHHADDQAETILMHIIRGSGIQGLTGMQSQSPLPYHPHHTLLRPFLTIHRQEIEEYCEENGLQPIIDQSNFDTRFRRNELRHEILPRLREINPQIGQSLLRLSEIIGTEQDFVDNFFVQHIKPHIVYTERVSVALEKFQSFHVALQRHLIMDALAYLGTEPNFDHIQNAIQIAQRGQVGAISQFSNNIQLRIAYDTIYFEPANLPPSTEDYYLIDKNYRLNVPSTLQFDNWQLTISDEILPDYDACISIDSGEIVYLRTRQTGDKFAPKGLNGQHQTLKKWMINKKIPAFVRDNLPIVTVGNKIMAIILLEGWRLSEFVKMTETSQRKIYFKVGKL